jgi:hypothetical protein
MRAGDCAGALDAFDQALRSAIIPELQRDRGICHEKLGHPFPAIDDYRAYLVARPSAPDADAVRARLTALEEASGVVKRGAAETPGGAAVSVSIGGETDLGPSSGRMGSGGTEAAERGEQLDLQADASPLRRGRGFAIGLAFDLKHYGDSAFGWAELVGINLRYSLSSVSTFMVELSVESVNSTGTPTALSGPGFLAGYEARIRLNPRMDDALLLGATIAYENLNEGASGIVWGFVEPRGRFGYRHIFGPSFGFEATLDAGVAFAHLTGNAGSASETTPLFGGHVGLVLGF